MSVLRAAPVTVSVSNGYLNDITIALFEIVFSDVLDLVLQSIAKPNMRPLVVAETGSWAAPAPGSQPLHYCTFQLTPSLSFLSRCAIVCFVMRIKMKILSSQGGHFLATIFVFRICIQCSVFPLYNVIMMRMKHLYVTIFVFKISNCCFCSCIQCFHRIL